MTQAEMEGELKRLRHEVYRLQLQRMDREMHLRRWAAVSLGLSTALVTIGLVLQGFVGNASGNELLFTSIPLGLLGAALIEPGLTIDDHPATAAKTTDQAREARVDDPGMNRDPPGVERVISSGGR